MPKNTDLDLHEVRDPLKWAMAALEDEVDTLEDLLKQPKLKVLMGAAAKDA